MARIIPMCSMIGSVVTTASRASMRNTSSPPDFVTRGRLAGEMGCNIETIRYYEQIGLMHAPERSDGGYRIYGEDGAKTAPLHSSGPRAGLQHRGAAQPSQSGRWRQVHMRRSP